MDEVIEKESQKQYIERFRKEALQNYYSYYTDEQQIERYTNNFLFWLERIPKNTYKYYSKFNYETKNFDYFNENNKKIIFEAEGSCARNEDNKKWKIATSKIIFLIDRMEEIGTNYIMVEDRCTKGCLENRTAKKLSSVKNVKKITTNKNYIIKNVINNLYKEYLDFMNEFKPLKKLVEKYIEK
jgi:hypothetical protein